MLVVNEHFLPAKLSLIADEGALRRHLIEAARAQGLSAGARLAERERDWVEISAQTSAVTG